MSAINIQEKKVVTISIDGGPEIHKGDLLLIRATTGEDILCYFKELNDGYFCTEAFMDREINRYRLKSITAALKVKDIDFYKEADTYGKEE